MGRRAVQCGSHRLGQWIAGPREAVRSAPSAARGPPGGRAERSGARLASGATEVLGFIAFLDVNWDVLGSSLFFYEAFLLGFLLGFLPGF